jgi:hypothetical protein
MAILPKTPYFDRLVDDFGIWQHTDGSRILKREGYALDDAARALLLTLSLNRKKQSHVLLSYIDKSLTGDGRFYGFAKSDRTFIKKFASDDATGQAVWAAGCSIRHNFEIEKSKKIIDEVLPYLCQTEHMRGYAYGLLGLILVDDEKAKKIYKKMLSFFENTTNDWPWPEETLTYGNGIMAYAFLRYGYCYHDESAIKRGRRILTFLEEICTKNRIRGPIGNEGWYPKDSPTVPEFSQQPIDAAYMIWAWSACYRISGDTKDRDIVNLWRRWFEGDNIAHKRMYNKDDLRCYDGIDRCGVHLHSGAESNICWLLSLFFITKNEEI